MLIELDANGKHCHAFRNREGAWQVSFRDVQKGRISAAQRDELNKFLSKQEQR